MKKQIPIDDIIERAGTYSVKWSNIGGTCKDYKNPEQKLPFQVADMDLPCPEPMIKSLHKVVDHKMYGYSADFTEPRYEKSIIDWYQRRFECHVEKEWLTSTSGSIEGVNTVIKAFSNVGDGIIISRPVYGHFTQCIEQETYRKVVDSHLINHDGHYTMDWEDFEKKCAEPTNRIYILCSPANPVGRVWTKEELQKIVSICKKNDVLLVSDEVHCDIHRKNTTHYPILSVTEDYSNIIMISAINKTFNTAGLLCAYAIIPNNTLRGVFKKELGEKLLTPFAIEALISAYNECDDWLEQMNDYIEENIDYAIDFISKNMPKVKVVKPEGTYILWLDFSEYGLSFEEIHHRIYEKANVILQDGIVHDPFYGGQFQRMCIPSPRPLLQEALERMAKEFS
ncbi:cystathione beta-lyase [Anaerovirgula multivorans]|uniref:cysteine-S-conjugate beta-lyase n=1 Tax=Anaerovirgula multivorans TaxID=312168 RepID=A0A239DI35_9FIRM|nr:aminotransferase class I/II-fold pyridoxal phosphate-dependent enzyme [Anaerovirgula multivorans]SNS31642.1 cystathione beta-lyase [Anaerovirgula multivorans]